MFEAKQVFIVDMKHGPSINIETQKPYVNKNYSLHSVDWKCNIQKILISQVCTPTPSHKSED